MAEGPRPLPQTSRRVYGVEGREPSLPTLQYVVSLHRPPSRALWPLRVLSVPGSRWCPNFILS
ncbi:hypothetical protein CTAM01_17294 [Colletotrichum tamarilloi]|uniref:Uncharacterized protein n=1 Tax=Colletotrichum tamarilloi TaxID=1209934 RepID=A0ABQ9QGD5_9PEZI|nr:uncharacterized protein CTAM01_17294 [Colletotrichum tamarilloi]KAK1451308.1 hypothetical protein CTAM01_17294 [Colletotrichum tamarilloi]